MFGLWWRTIPPKGHDVDVKFDALQWPLCCHGTGVVNTPVLNVRETMALFGGAPTGKRLGQISAGAQVDVWAQILPWLLIQTRDGKLTGFVWASYVSTGELIA